MDAQVLELAGRHRLEGELFAAGLEVAYPARDRGVDLIAYLEVGRTADRFVAKPIQMKAASRRSFGVWQKFEKIHDLIFAFVWHLDGVGDPETYALIYSEAKAVGNEMDWLGTDSWTIHGGYGTTRPNDELRERLKPYLMTPERWRAKITGSLPRP